MYMLHMFLDNITLVLYEDIMMTGRSSRICKYELSRFTATVGQFHNSLNMEKDRHEYKLGEEYVANVRTS